METIVRTFYKQSTDAKDVLWHHLQKYELDGYVFERQAIIEPYDVTFVCFDAKLIIEVVVGEQVGLKEVDKQKQKFLQSLGFRVLCFWQKEIFMETDVVLDLIANELTRFSKPKALPEGVWVGF